jgi:Leucine-rich repeat (LRR) protein
MKMNLKFLILYSLLLLNHFNNGVTTLNCPSSCSCDLTSNILTISSCTQSTIQLPSMISITSIIASNCGIQQFFINNCQNLTNLISLDLSFNQLKSLTNTNFNCLNNLTSLRLNNNNITTIDSDSFKNLTNLRFLYLSNNQISVIPQYLFETHLINLRVIDLSYNLMTEIELWPTYLSQIFYINLKYNSIQKFTNKFGWFFSSSSNLPSLTSTTTIDLQFNNISSIDDATIQQYGVCSYSDYSTFVIKYFYVFWLNNNPLVCNCSNSQKLVSDSINLLLTNKGLTSSNIYSSFCSQPIEYAGKRIINYFSCQANSSYPYCINGTSIPIQTKTTTVTTQKNIASNKCSKFSFHQALFILLIFLF